MCVLLGYCGQRGCVDVVVLNLRGVDGGVVDKGHMWMLLPAKSKGVGEVDVEAAVMGDVDRRAGVEVGRQKSDKEETRGGGSKCDRTGDELENSDPDGQTQMRNPKSINLREAPLWV
ncbi:hypothetical protein Bca52824_039332 [Brassica carinata]|uniref:Uncharacterized protein n=1 Tax=Brassica carinata TaxID=52824 RepID=A0A8X7RRG5_BRACI|nr:hypothetical protein Bca52824_039332 [Brassica carinata]